MKYIISADEIITTTTKDCHLSTVYSSMPYTSIALMWKDVKRTCTPMVVCVIFNGEPEFRPTNHRAFCVTPTHFAM